MIANYSGDVSHFTMEKVILNQQFYELNRTFPVFVAPIVSGLLKETDPFSSNILKAYLRLHGGIQYGLECRRMYVH